MNIVIQTCFLVEVHMMNMVVVGKSLENVCFWFMLLFYDILTTMDTHISANTCIKTLKLLKLALAKMHTIVTSTWYVLTHFANYLYHNS